MVVLPELMVFAMGFGRGEGGKRCLRSHRAVKLSECASVLVCSGSSL